MLRLFTLSSVFIVTLMSLIADPAFARRRSLGGDHAIGGGIILAGPSQNDVNSWVSSHGLAGTKELGAGYELFFNYEFRFSSTMFALHFRPSYLTQSASGAGIESSVTAITFFPMLRLYPLENDYIKFFFQTGIGVAKMDLKLSNSGNGGSGSYSATEFGAMAGLGASFCITESSCIGVEGNMRYLPMNRITGSGSPLGGNITQTEGELEQNNRDLAVTLSGIQGAITYQMNF